MDLYGLNISQEVPDSDQGLLLVVSVFLELCL